MKNCCDEYCANHGCNQGRNCPARAEPAEKPVSVLWIYFEAALFFVAIVMCYVCIVTWGATW